MSMLGKETYVLTLTLSRLNLPSRSISLIDEMGFLQRPTLVVRR